MSFKKNRTVFLVFFAVIVTLLSSLGVGASLWYYTTAHHPPSAAAPTSIPQTVQASSPSAARSNPTAISTSVTASPDPNIAGLYYGTIYDISTKVSTQMSLTQVQLTQVTINGSFAGLNRTGTFSGTIDRSKHIQFMVKDTAQHLIFSFDGDMQSDGDLSGDYCSVNQQAQCVDGYGIWSVAPKS